MGYICIRQYDTTDCAAACLATILKTYGDKASIAKIREVANTSADGTSALGIVRAAEYFGYKAVGVRINNNEIGINKNIQLPCIAHVVVNKSLQHYVVIHKITKKYIIVADPVKGIIKLTKEQFLGNGRYNDGDCYNWTGLMVIVVPKSSLNKDNGEKGLFGRFFHIVWAEKRLLINIVLATLLSSIIGIGTAFYYSTLIDTILPEKIGTTLNILSIATIGLYLVRIILDAFRTHMMLYLGQRIDISLLLGYYKHILQLPMNFFSTRKTGEIIARFSDASCVREAISGVTLTLMIDTSMVIFGGIILFMQNPKMFGITLLIVLLCTLTVAAFNNVYRKLNQEQMDSNAQLTSYLIESINGIQTIKSYNVEKTIIYNTENKFVRMLKSSFNLGFVGNIQSSLIDIVNSVGGVIILWVGGISVLKGEMSIGEIITFEALVGYFLTPLNNLISLQPQIQQATVSAERLSEILDIEIEKNTNEKRKYELDDLSGDIEFENVSFRYDDKKEVLKNINIKIKNGQKVAFVGGSGSGKSTLVKLLLHLYEVNNGFIKIDGNNINDIKIDTIRNRISYIPQEVFLYSGNIVDNLTFGINGYSMIDVMDAAKKAQAYEFICNMPLRFNTRLEENGSNLSGGQRQRLSIARALLKKSDILILDEATSSLDAGTENLLNSALKEHCKDKTTIIIAHRLSTIKDCDMIYALDNGEIVEYGSHEELIKKHGYYAKLVKQQSLERRSKSYE